MPFFTLAQVQCVPDHEYERNTSISHFFHARSSSAVSWNFEEKTNPSNLRDGSLYTFEKIENRRKNYLFILLKIRIYLLIIKYIIVLLNLYI